VFERFTDRARKVMDLASAETAQRGADVVDTVDILVGLIREGDGIAAHVLRAVSVTVEQIYGPRDSVSAAPDVTLADVESQALKETAWFRHGYVGTEHLLLALCCLKEGKAARILAGLGQPPVQLCSFILEILGHNEEWERWLLEHRDRIESRNGPLRSYCGGDHQKLCSCDNRDSDSPVPPEA
jgi:ATP-dependent Clp protease ATP-binding subunit ClpC